jgi:hypothetical protein
LGLQQVAIVSVSGYTEGAREKAKQHGILLHTLEEVLHNEKEVVAPHVLHFQPAIVSFDIRPTITIQTGTMPAGGILLGDVRVSVGKGEFQDGEPILKALVAEEVNRRLKAKEIELGWDETTIAVDVTVPVKGVRLSVPGVPLALLTKLEARVTLQNKSTEVQVPVKRWTYRVDDTGQSRDAFIMDLSPVMPNHSMEIIMEPMPDGSRRIKSIGPADPGLLDRKGSPRGRSSRGRA